MQRQPFQQIIMFQCFMLIINKMTEETLDPTRLACSNKFNSMMTHAAPHPLVQLGAETDGSNRRNKKAFERNAVMLLGASWNDT